MAEYIEREVAVSQANFIHGRWDDVYVSAATLMTMPAADVAPVVHGRWVEYQIPPIICCSNCDWATGIEEKNFQYCPNCGAKMDGGDSE